MAVTVNVYPSWKEKLVEAVNAGSDAFKVALLGAGGTYNSAHDEWADISAQEIANGDGYTTGGQSLANVTSAMSGSNYKFDADDADWTASGSGITAYGAVIYDDTVAGDPLVCHIDFGGAQTALAGAHFKLIWNASGIFTVS